MSIQLRKLSDAEREVVDDFGYALGAVQMGSTPPQAKPWKGEGSGVLALEQRGVTST